MTFARGRRVLASHNRRAARLVVRKSAFSEGKQFPILGIRLNLVVPQFGVESCEPIAKSFHLIQGEALHLPLDVLDSTHLKLHYQITLLVCGAQNDEWVFDSGAGNLACSRLSGGVCGHARVTALSRCRLKAGCSQD